MLSCQVSLYPLATNEFESIIVQALETLTDLQTEGLHMEVGSMSTVLKGPDEIVWQAVRRLFEAASKNGQRIVLTTTISNECGCDLPTGN